MPDSALDRDLAAMLGPHGVAGEDRARYETGYRYGRGTAAAVALPASTEEVRAIVQYCQTRGIQLIVQGAHTGLTGAATPDWTGAQLVLTTRRMTSVIDYSPIDRTFTCEAGTLLSAVNQKASEDGLVLPIDLAADPSIGGMIATNTGGAKLMRYGDMRRNLLGIEAVLFDNDATLWSDLGGLRKDNTGLDAKQLIVGTGGRFGVITAATVELQPLPRQTACALVVPRSLSDAPNITAALENRLGELMSACEGMSRDAMRLALEHHPALRNPFGDDLPEFALLIEVASSTPPCAALNVADGLAEAVWPLMEGPDALVVDARMSESRDFFALRHAISDGLARAGKVVAFDIAVRRSRLPALIERLLVLSSQLAPGAVPAYFGHFGDGGVHFNPVFPRDHDDHCVAMRDAVYRVVAEEFAGSISAEHGIGPHNEVYYRRHVPFWKQKAELTIAASFRGNVAAEAGGLILQ